MSRRTKYLHDIVASKTIKSLAEMMSKMAYIMNKESRKDNYIRMDNASVRVQSPGNVINSIQTTIVYKKKLKNQRKLKL